jgi:hypothetical protein
VCSKKSRRVLEQWDLIFFIKPIASAKIIKLHSPP